MRKPRTARKKRAPTHPWSDEKRSGAQYIIDKAKDFGGVAALERECGVCSNQLAMLLSQPGRGCLGATALKIHAVIGLPIAAILSRELPIWKVIDRDLGSGA